MTLLSMYVIQYRIIGKDHQHVYYTANGLSWNYYLFFFFENEVMPTRAQLVLKFRGNSFI